MNRRFRAALAAFFCVAPTVAAAAQSVMHEAAAAVDPAPTLTPPQTVAPSTLPLPSLTEIELTVLEAVTSKTAVIGHPVKLALARAVYLSPELGIPAGTPVEGVVIHAAKGGMGGKSGELLLGAKRIILSESLSVPLRSFKLAPARGKNNEGIAFASSVAGGAIGATVAMFIVGGSATVPQGMTAVAKTRSDTEIPVVLLSKLPVTAPASAPPVSAEIQSE